MQLFERRSSIFRPKNAPLLGTYVQGAVECFHLVACVHGMRLTEAKTAFMVEDRSRAAFHCL